MKLKSLTIGLALALLGVGCESGGGNEAVLPGVQAIVFIKRAYVTDDGSHNVSGDGRVVDYQRYTPGGGLFVLSPATPSGTLTNLTAAFDGVDVNGMDLSFDARQVAFSMRRTGDDNYHLYVANVDGSAEVRQLTFGPYDDIKPVWVPGDRLAFTTNQPYTAMGTRADEYNHSRQVAQIATVSVAAGDADRRVCAQNLSHTADPFLLADGRIGFSRWEHLGPVNDVKLFAMNTDCSQMVALAGQHGKPSNSIVQVREMRSGVFIGVATSRSGTIQAGSLVQIDARARAGTAGIAMDEQHASFSQMTPAVPTTGMSPATGIGRYRAPVPIAGSDRLLVSWSDGDVNDLNELAGTAPNFGIYLFDPASRQKTLVYDDPGMWDLYATPVVPRDVPPVRAGVIAPMATSSTPAVLGSVDVTQTSLNENVDGAQYNNVSLATALRDAKRVRIIEGFSSEIGGVGQFGLTMHEGAAILGEAQVYADGSWEAQVPPYLPYHLQPIDRFGLAIRNQLLWIQAMPGESRRCGGCHEGRADTILPRMGTTTLAQQAGAEDFVRPIPERTELPWYGAATGETVQSLLTRKCASCHDGSERDPFRGRFYTVTVTPEGATMPLTFQIPYLDLSDRPVDTFYENEVVSYPASYVSLLYPSAMMGDSMATGDMPPVWITPGSARESVAIAKMNAQAEDDTNAWAWTTRPHPEDQGVTLTREERLLLIRMADLGGQYYSRRNSSGAAMWATTDY